MAKKIRGLNLGALPKSQVCEECQEGGGWWLHLRRCAECGHVACCDSSPSQHARRHAESSGHPVVQSFEPLQNWFFDYESEEVFKGPRLLPPSAHREDQPAPGPLERVPENWEELLNEKRKANRQF